MNKIRDRLMSSLDDMRALIEVINSDGFSKAARRLGVSKSIVSRRLARLEKDLGVRLINRTTRGMSLTDAGLEYGERIKRILSDLSEARDAVTKNGAEISGRLRLSLPLSFGLRRMGPLLARLHALHPRLKLDIAYSDSTVDLLAENFDAAVRIGRLKDSGLVARQIAPIDFLVVASPAYLRKHGAPKVPNDLTRHECLIYTGGKQLQTWRFRTGKRRFTVSPNGRFHADNGESLIQAAEAGLGVAALPDFIVGESIKSGALTRLFPAYTLQEGEIYVVRPPGHPPPAKTRLFIDLMLDFFAR